MRASAFLPFPSTVRSNGVRASVFLLLPPTVESNGGRANEVLPPPCAAESNRGRTDDFFPSQPIAESSGVRPNGSLPLQPTVESYGVRGTVFFSRSRLLQSRMECVRKISPCPQLQQSRREFMERMPSPPSSYPTLGVAVVGLTKSVLVSD